ncbi:PREDICTED: uncharacterized protein LOC108379182 [Rhagoletis zephyria]|uniref:uncharacterized protein LOC108379182 n=1 Tax=Rhagoletis zephyria TaxID=28612 RepID=UPI000811355F|nr:PREDICTED: uncharacterized protein LOC108379182 [Rhagoletis zephyria]
MCVSKQPWTLIVGCALLCPTLLLSGTYSTPIAARRGHQPTPCAHDSIAALIKKSPIILKALGAHIFTDDARAVDLLGAGAVNDQLKWQNAQNNFFASGTLHSAAGPTAATAAARQRQQQRVLQFQQKQQPLTTAERRHSDSDDGTPASSASVTTAHSATAANSAKALDESILITLTPETIYKGASLLKMTPGTENAARSSGGGGGGGVGGYGRGDGSGTGHNGSYGNGSGGSATPESAYQYEGQLNATLQPLSCFDGNLLKILPTELIVFGKLVTGQQQQQQQQLPGELHATQQMDFLSISINGLHRWSPQFENHIWKHLGE